MAGKRVIKTHEKAKELKGYLDYYDWFNYTPNLGKAIDTIIGLITDRENSFRVMNFYFNDNSELVVDSGDQTDELEQYSAHYDANLAYLVVAANNVFPVLERTIYHNSKHINMVLKRMAECNAKDKGIISPKMFPYKEIQEFFYLLNRWRFDTGRVTLDDEAIESCLNQVVANLDVSTGGRIER